jgi:hypothetical protein
MQAAAPDQAPAQPLKPHKLLIFTLTKGFRHSSIPLAAEAVKFMADDDVNLGMISSVGGKKRKKGAA